MTWNIVQASQLSSMICMLFWAPSLFFNFFFILKSPKSWPLQVEMWLWDSVKSSDRESDSSEVGWTLAAVFPWLSHTWLFGTLCIAAQQASLSFTSSLLLQYCCSCLLWACHPRCCLSIWRAVLGFLEITIKAAKQGISCLGAG